MDSPLLKRREVPARCLSGLTSFPWSLLRTRHRPGPIFWPTSCQPNKDRVPGRPPGIPTDLPPIFKGCWHYRQPGHRRGHCKLYLQPSLCLLSETRALQGAMGIQLIIPGRLSAWLPALGQISVPASLTGCLILWLPHIYITTSCQMLTGIL
jgi:hypothetical protein